MKSVFVLLFRNEKLELQTAMALSLSKEDPSELPSPSSKPQEPKKHKSEDRGNNGEFTANETAALADFPVLAGSQEVSNVVDKSKETKKTTTSYSYGQAANASLHSKDGFPTLEASAQLLQEQPHTIPPGFAAAARQPPLLSVPQQTSRTKPPPGFQSFSQIAKGKVKENIAPVEDTTISKPEVKTSNSKQERNQMLIEKIRGLLGYDKTKFDEFKAVSGKFRKGDCSAAESLPRFSSCPGSTELNPTTCFPRGESTELKTICRVPKGSDPSTYLRPGESTGQTPCCPVLKGSCP